MIPLSSSKLFLVLFATLFVNTFGDEDDNGRLLLTPYIKSGKLEEARMKSLVRWDKESLEGIPSYSGFLTVNKLTNSNLFFWFVPAMVEDPDDAPLMLWLNDGSSGSMFGFFVENGPFKIKKRGRIPKLVVRVRKDTWARRHNMLYIDSPIGTGFSFTDHPSGYPKSQDNVVRDLYEALDQFYKLFPSYTNHGLFLAGEGYASKTILRLALYIHNHNSTTHRRNLIPSPTLINVKGLIFGSPMIDPPSLTTSYSSYLYNLGLIDDKDRSYISTQESLANKLSLEGKYSSAQDVKNLLLFSPNSYLSNVTGYSYFANILDTKVSKKRDYYVRFLNQTSTKRVIHVGDQTLTLSLQTNQTFLTLSPEEGETSSKSDFEHLLSLNYRILLYSGQLDMIVPHTGVSRFLHSLNYKGSFNEGERRIIRDLKRNDVLGYVKAYDNLYYVMIRSAGHHCPSDQPRWTREVVERFVNNDQTF